MLISSWKTTIVAPRYHYFLYPYTDQSMGPLSLTGLYTCKILVKLARSLYSRKMNVFRNILEAACLSLHACVCTSICVQNTCTSIFVSQTPSTVLLYLS